MEEKIKLLVDQMIKENRRATPEEILKLAYEQMFENMAEVKKIN